MRTVLVIRRAHSTAEELALEDQHAQLTDRGKEQITELVITLYTQYGIVCGKIAAATSEFKRAKHTAALLGFRHTLTTTSPLLNEVNHGMELRALRAMLYQNYIPEVALKTAEKVLEEPPSGDIWVTHGLLTAALCILCGTSQQYRQIVPGYGEMRPLTF